MIVRSCVGVSSSRHSSGRARRARRRRAPGRRGTARRRSRRSRGRRRRRAGRSTPLAATGASVTCRVAWPTAQPRERRGEGEADGEQDDRRFGCCGFPGAWSRNRTEPTPARAAPPSGISRKIRSSCASAAPASTGAAASTSSPPSAPGTAPSARSRRATAPRDRRPRGRRFARARASSRRAVYSAAASRYPSRYRGRCDSQSRLDVCLHAPQRARRHVACADLALRARAARRRPRPGSPSSSR